MNTRHNVFIQCFFHLSIWILPTFSICHRQESMDATHTSNGGEGEHNPPTVYRYPILMAPATAHNQSTMVLLTNLDDREVTVQVTTTYTRNVTVNPRSYETLSIPRPLNGNHVTSQTERCGTVPSYLSSHHPISVSAINIGSCSSYLNLQSDLLGTLYEVITWSTGLSTPGQSTVSIVAQENQTLVDVTLPTDQQCDVIMGRIQFKCGDTFRLYLEPYESVSFVSSADLSRTLVTSAGRIAVFAGNSGITIGPGNVTDQTMSELLPITGWTNMISGSVYSYPIPSIPENDHSGYSVRVTSGGINTRFTVKGDTYQLLQGRVLTLDFPDNAPTILQGQSPLQVIQFVRGATVSADSGAPASQVIPEKSQYASRYAFTNPPGYTHYIIVIMESNASRAGLVVDGVVMEDDSTGWRPITGTELVTKGIRLAKEGLSRISHRSGVAFGAFRYSFIRGNCAYAYPAGVVMTTSQVTTPGLATTGSSFATSLGSPSTTVPTTVSTTTPDCSGSNSGSNFLLTFMENRNSADVNLVIYPVPLMASPAVNVSVTTWINSSTGFTWSFPLPGGDRRIVALPPEVELKGTESSAVKAVQVTSSDDISLVGMNSVPRSCDGFLALPVDGLGVEYFTLSYFPPDQKTQLAIVAVHNNTKVTVRLRLATRPGMNIMWNGVKYTNAANRNIIQMSLNERDVVQVQDNSDLTGTLLTSNLPVAVFSGNDITQVEGSPTSPLNASHLVEQLPPVDELGSTFYLVPLPENSGGYLVKMVATLDDTTVVFSDVAAPAITPIHLTSSSDFTKIRFSSSSFVTVRSTKPILLAQLGLSTSTTSPTMSIIPPAEKYKSSYSFSTGEDNTTNHYLMLVANKSSIDRLQIDGRAMNQSGWTQFSNDSQMWSFSSVIASGIHRITQLDGTPFAAYVYGRSVRGCAYSYPAGLCLKSRSQPSSSATSSSSPQPSSLSPSSSSYTTSILTEEETVKDCSCLTITSSLEPSYNGVYYQLQSDDLYNSYPVYQRKDTNCSLFLYKLQLQASFWNIGPSIGSTMGAIHSAYNDTRLPYNVTRWRVYSADNESFVDDQYVTIDCSCPVRSKCLSVEFINITNGRSIFDGVFYRQKTTSDGRPLYKHEQLPLQFSYQSSLCGAYWSVRTDQEPGSRVMKIRSDAFDPEELTGADAWLLYDTETSYFETHPEVRLSCYTSSSVS